MELQIGDIVERGVGIAKIRDIKGEVAVLSYMERDLEITQTWTSNLSDLSLICHSKELEDKLIPSDFREQIKERNIELKHLQMENVKRLQEKASKVRARKEKSEEEKKMDLLLNKLTPSQILDLLG
jgi:hypothetical protein